MTLTGSFREGSVSVSLQKYNGFVASLGGRRAEARAIKLSFDDSNRLQLNDPTLAAASGAARLLIS
jgi:hypothetical protein